MGRVCEKHNEFYETECKWCGPGLNAAMPAQSLFGIDEPPPILALRSCDDIHGRLSEISGGGRCGRCGYDILPVRAAPMRFAAIPTLAESLGALEIGPGETKFWMDFINTRYCKADE